MVPGATRAARQRGRRRGATETALARERAVAARAPAQSGLEIVADGLALPRTILLSGEIRTGGEDGDASIVLPLRGEREGRRARRVEGGRVRAAADQEGEAALRAVRRRDVRRGAP